MQLNTFKIIVALDFNDIEQANALIRRLDPNQFRLKVGITLFTLAGPKWVALLHEKGFEVFLDLKFHDIPYQVRGACFEAAKLGVWMLNVHALGGKEMLLAAKEGVDKANQSSSQTLLIAVTILTSFNQAGLNEIGIDVPLTEQVLKLAHLSNDCQLDGVVCSAHEVRLIKKEISESFLCVTPGIRLPEDDLNDQKRVLTPKAALELGSDHLVMGRSIVNARDPNTLMQKICRECQYGLV